MNIEELEDWQDSARREMEREMERPIMDFSIIK